MKSLLLWRTVAMTMTAKVTVIATIKLKVSHLTRVKNLKSQSIKVAPLLSLQNLLKRRKSKILSHAPLMHQKHQRKRGRMIRLGSRSIASQRASPPWCHSWIGLMKICRLLWRKRNLLSKRKEEVGRKTRTFEERVACELYLWKILMTLKTDLSMI